MAKNDILELFETDMTDPGSWKSGEYLKDHVLQHATNVLSNDRDGLIDALHEWLKARSEPRTTIAVTVARKLGLKELRPDIEELRRDVDNGQYFPRFYLENIDATLKSLT